MFRASMVAAALLASGWAGTAAQAQQVVNQGEQFEVHYPAGYAGNIVGGGEVLRTLGESPRVIYSAPLHSLSARWAGPRRGLPAGATGIRPAPRRTLTGAIARSGPGVFPAFFISCLSLQRGAATRSHATKGYIRANHVTNA